MRINLSRNELKALLTRTFEALYGHSRDYHDMAHTVLWLECAGHGGLARVVESLPCLEDDGLEPPSLTQKSASHLIMRGGGHSLFCLSRSICDLTLALANDHSTARLDVSGTQDSQAMIGVLHCAARQGFAAAVIGGGFAARIEAGAEFPVVYTADNNDDVSFICTQSETVLNDYLNDLGGVVITPDTQAQNHADSLERGIDISQAHYDILTEIANRILVEATEASRKGAGE